MEQNKYFFEELGYVKQHIPGFGDGKLADDFWQKSFFVEDGRGFVNIYRYEQTHHSYAVQELWTIETSFEVKEGHWVQLKFYGLDSLDFDKQFRKIQSDISQVWALLKIQGD